MSDELDRITERVRQNRTARQPLTDDSRAHATTPATRPGGTFIAGDRVFDTVSGREGTVVSATGFGSAQLGTVGVRLDGDGSVTRKPTELIFRPTRP